MNQPYTASPITENSPIAMTPPKNTHGCMGRPASCGTRMKFSYNQPAHGPE